MNPMLNSPAEQVFFH